MDRISYLPDETISKVLSFLQTKDVMQTMVLSKRWRSLWMVVPRLEFNVSTHFPKPKPVSGSSPEPGYGRFQRFVDRSLIAREGQVLQSLDLKLDNKLTDGDMAIWVGTAVKRGLRELKLSYSGFCSTRMPKSLYTCETLVVLNLTGVCLEIPELVCLSSLKTLSLKSIVCYNVGSLLGLFNCPVLEDLFINGILHNPTLGFEIVMPSLKRLSLLAGSTRDLGITGLVIDAPLLKFLHIVDRSGNFLLGDTINISQVVEANVEVILSRPEKLLDSLASVERMRLCLSASEVVYPVDSCFNRLKHLEVCTCKSEWLGLFMQLLENSPSLKVIKINQRHPVANPRPQWNQPGSVPRCLSSNLETLEWINYEGTQDEKELSTYILKTAVCLKKASFTTKSEDPKTKLQMLQELSLSRRVSSTCQLVFK